MLGALLRAGIRFVRAGCVCVCRMFCLCTTYTHYVHVVHKHAFVCMFAGAAA